jgi:hypothetical protein
MTTDEELLRAYEAELGSRPPAPRNRGFWVVLGIFVASGAFLVVEILAHRPLANSIGLAQQSLRSAEREARVVLVETDGYAAADADGLRPVLPALTLGSSTEPSTGVRDVSVSASATVWAAAVQARPQACFYLRLEVGRDPLYGAGDVCTGVAALEADQPRW